MPRYPIQFPSSISQKVSTRSVEIEKHGREPKYKFDFSFICKIRLRTIHEAIPFKPIPTDVQKKWINGRNIKLDNLFSATLKTSSTVKDFYKRATCQLLRSNNGHCELFGTNFDSFTSSSSVPLLEKIEEKI